MSDMIQLCGLWLQKSKDGKVYMAGKLSQNVRVLVFKNERKEKGSKQPDYQLFLAPARERNEEKAEE